MKFRYFIIPVFALAIFACSKPSVEVPEDPDQQQQQQQPQDTTSQFTPIVSELPPQVKDGDEILVTNAIVEQFITEVTYPENDYSETHILDEKYGPTAPGKYDKPQEYTIRWEANPSAGEPVVRLWADDGWSREYTGLSPEDTYQYITNLLPYAKYHFEVKAGETVLTSGSFTTIGHLHQLFFKGQVRNCRDLGGWKTKDGKTVKYRMIYRGGRLQSNTINSTGKKDILLEGIRAQLDLRGDRDVLDESPVPEFEFYAPHIEEGYVQMLKDDQEKTRQCMEFIMNCVKENKPVYFHCSLGRDRTGTVSMLILGLLGVDEGEISKEYELTQFAPHGYATSDGEKTKMTRKVDYKGAAKYIWEFAGEGGSFADAVQTYLLQIGITQEQIDEFRSIMLE